MKTTLSLLLALAIITSCNIKKSYNKDLNTGAVSIGDGISVGSTSKEVNGNISSKTTFVYGEKVDFIFDNVEGLTNINGKVFPGLSIYIVQNGKDTLMQSDDLLTEFDNGTDLTPLKLNAHFLSILPYNNGEKYMAYVNIFDKKGEGTFRYEFPFEVEANKYPDVKLNNASYNEIYLWDETTKLVISDGNININNQLALIIEHPDGFKEVDGRIYATMPFEIVDRNYRAIIKTEDVLGLGTDGADANTFKTGQIPVTFNFTPGEITNPCYLKSTLIDRNSDSRIEISAELVIK